MLSNIKKLLSWLRKLFQLEKVVNNNQSEKSTVKTPTPDLLELSTRSQRIRANYNDSTELVQPCPNCHYNTNKLVKCSECGIVGCENCLTNNPSEHKYYCDNCWYK